MIEEKKPIENEEDIDIEEMEEKELLNDYQVVRREFFAHTFDAAVTLGTTAFPLTRRQSTRFLKRCMFKS